MQARVQKCSTTCSTTCCIDEVLGEVLDEVEARNDTRPPVS
jgi:hypothetical protein